MTKRRPKRKRKASPNWSVMALPKSLMGRILELAERLDKAWSEGRSDIAPSDVTEKIPPYKIVAKAIGDYEDHLERSNRRGKPQDIMGTPDNEDSEAASDVAAFVVTGP